MRLGPCKDDGLENGKRPRLAFDEHLRHPSARAIGSESCSGMTFRIAREHRIRSTRRAKYDHFGAGGWNPDARIEHHPLPHSDACR